MQVCNTLLLTGREHPVYLGKIGTEANETAKKEREERREAEAEVVVVNGTGDQMLQSLKDACLLPQQNARKPSL